MIKALMNEKSRDGSPAPREYGVKAARLKAVQGLRET